MITTISSIVIEVIGGNFFFYEEISHTKKEDKQTKKDSIFYSHKKLHKQTKRGQHLRPKKHKKIHKQTKRDSIFLFAQKSIKTT